MRNSIKYIFILCILALVCSCVEKEFFEPAQKVEKDTPVVFTATPKGFTKANVGTRAGEEEEDGSFNATRFENTIYNAYFLLFDHTGLLRIKEKATINEEGAVSYNIGRDVLSIFTTFRICFIANITDAVYADFVVNTTKWSDLQSYYFNVTYAPISETGCPGVPQKTDLNNDGIYEYAMPMIGSKEVNAPYNSAKDYYSFQLVRMFARVEMHVSLGIQQGQGLSLASRPQFTLTDCKIHNIPLSAPLLAQSGPTLCSDTSQQGQVKEEDLPSYNLTTGLNRILYTSSESSPDYRSFYFYMPEHKLGNCGSNSTQSNKPDLVKNTTKRPTYISFGGYLVGGDGATYRADYNIYFGENASDNFDLTRNKLYKNYVRINGVNNADHRVTIVKDEEIKDITRSGQTANCYIIGQEGTYMLPAYKGAFTDMSKAVMCEVGEDVVLACDNTNFTITIDKDRSKQSTIVFTVENSSDLFSGNAVIARKDASGNIIWSWHLWFIPELTTSWGSSTDDLGNPNRVGGLLEADMYDGTTMADRNIGVVASISNLESWMPSTMGGVYYKYGHHNPYFEDKVYGNGATYHGFNSDADPTWDTSTKSKTDPCPPGYRMPPISVWQGSNAKNSTNEHYSANWDFIISIHVEAFRYWARGVILGVNSNITDDIYYPYGYLTPSGVVSSGTEDMPFTLKTELSETSGRSEGTATPSNPGRLEYQYRTVTYTRTTYSELNYIVPSVTCNVGSLLTQSTDENIIFKTSTANVQKSHVTNNSEFISCRKIVTQVSVTERRLRKLISGYYDWEEYGTSTQTVTSNQIIYDRNSITADWKAAAANELIGSNNSSAKIGTTVTDVFNPANGYQVRCIME